MKPPSNVKTPAQYMASLPADRAKTIATVRALVNKHIPRGVAVYGWELVIDVGELQSRCNGPDA